MKKEYIYMADNNIKEILDTVLMIVHVFRKLKFDHEVDIKYIGDEVELRFTYDNPFPVRLDSSCTDRTEDTREKGPGAVASVSAKCECCKEKQPNQTSAIMCNHANESPAQCTCYPNCYCRVTGACANRP